MSDRIKEATEKYAESQWDAEMYRTHCRVAFTAGANFMLEELSKSGEAGEFIEYWITDHTDNSGYTLETKKNPKSFGACNYHHMIDIAALQSARAKIAKLTEALKDATQNKGDKNL